MSLDLQSRCVFTGKSYHHDNESMKNDGVNDMKHELLLRANNNEEAIKMAGEVEGMMT